MRKSQTLAMVNGKRLRVTRLDACGRIVYGDNNVAVSKGFVSVASKTNTTTTSAVQVKNADGETIVNQPEVTAFSNESIEIVFAAVDPEVFALITGQSVTYDFSGNPNGFTIDSAVGLSDQGFALEVWAGSPAGDACDDQGAQGSYGYALWPFLQGGVLGDHTFQEGAVSFTITGVTTRDGNAWGRGPYKVEIGASSQPATLVAALTSTTHELLKVVGVAPPAAYDGTRPQLDPTAAAVTAITYTPTTGHAGTLGATGATSGTGVWWDFGDGTWDYVVGTSVTHTFPATGTYTVTASSNGTVVTHSTSVA